MIVTKLISGPYGPLLITPVLAAFAVLPTTGTALAATQVTSALANPTSNDGFWRTWRQVQQPISAFARSRIGCSGQISLSIF